MIHLSRFVNYELIFMRNGRSIKFNSSSLQEIKDVNQILIDMDYDLRKLEKASRYEANGRYYNLRYRNGEIKILDSFDRNTNKYFMPDNIDINVVDKEKLNAKLIFEDSDDYLERNDDHEIVLSRRNDADSHSTIQMPNENRRSMRSFQKNAIRYDDILGDSNDESGFYSRGEDNGTRDEASYSEDRYNDENFIISENDSQKINDIDNNYAYDNVRRREARRLYNDEPRNISNKYPRYNSMPSLNSTAVFKKNIDDEDAETRDKIIRLASYIDSSSHRSLVFNDISNSIKTPKTIALETGLRPNYVSKVLRDFKARDIVVCINEEARKGKLYELTELGLKIFSYLHRIDDF